MDSRKDLQVPFTGDELRTIADRIDEIINDLPDHTDSLPDDHWMWGLAVDVFTDGYKVGQVRPYPDGWIGFYPEGWD